LIETRKLIISVLSLWFTISDTPTRT